jgi:hypothetical protein
MKEIPLTKGAVALVDDIDYDYLMQWKWHLSSRGYAMRDARRKVKGWKVGHAYQMGQVVAKRMGLQSVGSQTVDHENRNRLDNRRENLRLATKSEQTINSENGDGVFFDKKQVAGEPPELAAGLDNTMAIIQPKKRLRKYCRV